MYAIQNLALNNVQGLICYKNPTNQTTHQIIDDTIIVLDTLNIVSLESSALYDSEYIRDRLVRFLTTLLSKSVSRFKLL